MNCGGPQHSSPCISVKYWHLAFNDGCWTLGKKPGYIPFGRKIKIPTPKTRGIAALRGIYSEDNRHSICPIRLANIDLAPSQIPINHEYSVEDFFIQGCITKLNIVIGNFNCGVASTAATPQCITTVVEYDENKQVQVARATSGAFYTSGIEIKQATIVHLNPQTGKPIDNSINLHERISSTSSPITLNIEDSNANIQIYMNLERHDAQIIKIQRELHKFWGNGINLRIATDINNSKTIALLYSDLKPYYLPKEIANNFTNLLKSLKPDSALTLLVTNHFLTEAISTINKNLNLPQEIKRALDQLMANPHIIKNTCYNCLRICLIKIIVILHKILISLKSDNELEKLPLHVIKTYITEFHQSVDDISVPDEIRSVISDATNVLHQILIHSSDDIIPINSDEVTPKQQLLALLKNPPSNKRVRDGGDCQTELPSCSLAVDEHTNAEHENKKLNCNSPVRLLDHLLEVQNNDQIDNNIKKKFQEFYDVVLKLESEPNESDKIIINQIVSLAENIIQNPRLSLETLQQSATELDEKLYGKAPASISLKVAACGVIGAVVGAVLGVAVGAAVTGWGGGFGAIPGIIAGAFTGWTVATTTMVASAGACAAIASGISFWRGKKTANNFQTHKRAEDQKVTPTILNAEKTFFAPGAA